MCLRFCMGCHQACCQGITSHHLETTEIWDLNSASLVSGIETRTLLNTRSLTSRQVLASPITSVKSWSFQISITDSFLVYDVFKCRVSTGWTSQRHWQQEHSLDEFRDRLLQGIAFPWEVQSAAWKIHHSWMSAQCTALTHFWPHTAGC